MTFFVDANVLVYSAIDSDYTAPCADVIAAVAAGEVEGRMSTAVLEEVWHLELSGRLGEAAGLALTAYTTFTPLLVITDDTLARALELDAEGLGANDRIHVATCLENGIDTIVTADAGFEGVRGLRCIDPLDAQAVSRLLKS